jgi:regulatory protein
VERRRPEQNQPGEGTPRRSARDAAFRLLRRRPRTRAELTQELGQLGHQPDEIDAIVRDLEDAGHVNDADLARHYITTRSARLAHGRERLLAELERRGVPRAQAEQAWNEALESGEVDPQEQLRSAIRRRTQGRSKLDSKGIARVYNALLRAGYVAEEVRRELEPYHSGDSLDMIQDEEMNDDLP